MGLCSHPGCCLLFVNSVLESTGSLARLLVTSKKDLCQFVPPRTAAASAPAPCSRPLLTHASTEDPQTLTVYLSLLWSHYSLHWIAHWCAQDFVCALQESLFPPVLWKFCNQIPLSFRSDSLGIPSLFAGSPRLGRLMWGIEPSQKSKNFLGIIVLQFLGHPPNGYGIWFYRDFAPTSLQLLLCPWMWLIFSQWVPTAPSMAIQ